MVVLLARSRKLLADDFHARLVQPGGAPAQVFFRVANDARIEQWMRLAQPKHAALKQQLAQYMTKTSAPPKPERSQYDFDFKTHTFRLRQ